MPHPRLRYASDQGPGIRRKRRAGGFSYLDSKGKSVRAAGTLARIRALAVPPAWTDVWISPHPKGHLQATGRDARGRKQYRYHAAFRAAQEENKFAHLAAFAAVLPAIRAAVSRHLKLKGLPREKVLATVVHLLETTLIRVGNEDYVRANGSFGLTTLRDPHVDVAGAALRFHFKGKSGRAWRLKVTDRRVARTVKACQDLPGQHLFQYRDDSGRLCAVTSSDVNAYLREISGADITAKEFRTWSATVLAALVLKSRKAACSESEAKRTIKSAIAEVAERLGNTVSVCRKCYVHPAIISRYRAGKLAAWKKGRRINGLHQDETAVLTLLRDNPN
jgi:DNA topoisomerase I